MNNSQLRNSSIILLVGTLAGSAWSDPLDIHRNDGVQIVFNQDLRSDFNEPGDRVTAMVTKDPELPKDTILSGRILRVHPATRFRAASMDMIFTSLQLPKGPTFAIDAVPTPANDPHLSRGGDGRIVAAYKPGEDSEYALGGTVGGLILGGIGHRPILGAFFGGLIGSIAGSVDRQANANLVIRKGEKMVAVFNEDVAATANRPTAPWHHSEGPVSSHPMIRTSPVPDIRVNGAPIKFEDQKPYVDGGTVMVPLVYMADQFNLIATVHGDGAITLDGPDFSVQLRTNSTSFGGPGNNSPLGHPVDNHEGVVYVPIQAFSRLIGDPISVDGAVVKG